MTEFGELIKTLRNKKEISQRKLAELVDLDFTYISKIEKGKMAPPSQQKIIKIAEVLGESPDKLLITAEKVPTDYNKIIFEYDEVQRLLRNASNFSKDQWEKLRQILDEVSDETAK